MYDTTLLAKTTGASLGVLALVGLLFLSTGTAYALPVAGIGGFTIQADSIEGDDMLLYLGIDEVAGEGDYPQSVVELRKNRIDGLTLTKEVALDEVSGDVLDGNARLKLESDDGVVAERLVLKTPSLNADSATFSGLEISESGSDDLNKMFDIKAPADPDVETRQIDLDGGENPGLVMENAEIEASYLATDEITLPGLELDVQYDADGDGDYDD